MTPFTAKIRKRVLEDAKSQSLSREELAFMLEEFTRVAQLDMPESDSTIEPIAQTNDEWHRQKPLKDNRVYVLRNIIKIDRSKQIIELVAILRKTDRTYDIAERLWDEDQ